MNLLSILNVALVLLLSPAQDRQLPYAGNPVSQGRAGNDRYEAEAFAEAAEAYRSGIRSVQEEGPGRVHSGLLNNLGASLYRQGEFESAAAGFASSARMAPDAAERARGLYNAGNALMQAQKLEEALELYREALLEDPSNEDAKHNYELARRQLEEQQKQDQQQDGEQDEGENEDQQNQGNEDQNQSENEEDGQQDEQQQSPDEQEQQQNQGDEGQQDPQQPEEQDGQPQQNPETLTREEAKRMLEALQNQEEQLLREVQKLKTRPRRVDKDW